jgi:hypothetical protein
MTQVRAGAWRWARSLTAVALMAGSATVGFPSPANAVGFGDGIYIACPDVTTLAYKTTPTCESLATAVFDAEAWNAGTRVNATIDLLPGKYCPISLPYDPYDLTLQGVGFAGVKNASDISSYTGFEAALSEFTWVGGTCTGTPPDYLDNAPDPANSNHIWGDITLLNFTVHGAVGGPTDGIKITNAGFSGRDLLAENVPGVGFRWSDAFDFYSGGIVTSAFVNNGTGANISAGQSHGFSIDESTAAGNTGAGIVGAGNVNVGGATVAHNGIGLSGGIGQLGESIIGNNTTNCGGSIAQDFGGSVEGPGCPGSGSGDVALSSVIGSLTTGGALTPSIAPVTEAAGIVSGVCGFLDGVDQEELVTPDPCYAGSVQPAGTSATPTPSVPSVAFGNVPTNEPSYTTINIQPAGGLVGVNGLATQVSSGTGTFSIDTDGCTYRLVVAHSGCSVTIEATSTDTSGDTAGTLSFDTTDGPVTVNLSSTGAPAITPPAAPTNLAGSPGNHTVHLSWTATPPADDGGQPIQYYEIDASTDAGATWTSDFATTGTGSGSTVTDDVGSLPNGVSYEFRVRANNGLLTSAPSGVVTITPHAPPHASSLAAPKAATIVVGHSTTVTTKLTDSSTGTPIGSAHVTLLARTGSSGAFTQAAKAITGSAGRAGVKVAPTSTTSYEWSYAGTASHTAVTSHRGKVTVDQSVHASLTKHSVAHGKPTKVFGTITPARSGRAVTLQRLVGGTWKKVATATTRQQTLPDGTHRIGYVVSYSPTRAGKQKLRVVVAATPANGAGASATLTLTVS